MQTKPPLDLPKAWTAPRDIAELDATTLLSPGRSGRRVQAVHGLKDLTWAKVERLLSGDLDRETVVRRIADQEMREQMLRARMPDPMVKAMLDMSAGLRDGSTSERGRPVVTTTLRNARPKMSQQHSSYSLAIRQQQWLPADCQCPDRIGCPITPAHRGPRRPS